jgi:dephospho-CoA kinase
MTPEHFEQRVLKAGKAAPKQTARECTGSRAQICVTGGIASGKSTVAKMFADFGAIILDADQAARDVVRPGTPCWKQLMNLLGLDYFDEQGQLKRRLVRQRIIADQQCRSEVNTIMHPAIMAALREQSEYWRRTDPARPVIFEIPLVFEANLAAHFDCIVLVFVPRVIQIERLMERDNLSREEAEQSLSMQLPIEEKRKYAHRIVDNSVDLEHTRRQVEALWKEFSLPTEPEEIPES